ncbi:hypothetical protein [Thalassoglobus polymorphus]|uniref:Uncharacterized protein n=1 Tax=Thalassoglobus polymorphus TaxID=2527994 RepID=A0A517QTX7_9PLAN|nr:hypothetical protein [Thalassoglobus polymorphus]QDT35095.1 hypothetical protein Mal48_43700 [Thalassoglobus polymorphus]
MLIADAEVLKKEWTDQYVIVNESIPELRRFVGLTGQVKTVNMNCRALVEFDGPVDISWYDIDPSCLIKVDAPLPKKKEAKAEKKAPAKPAAAPKAGGASPLEMARKQGAAGAGEKKLSPLEMARQQGAAGAAPAAGGEKKLSPLEMARQQGAAGKKETPAATPAAEKKLSPLELARQQGAAKAAGEQTEEASVEETPAEAVEAPVEETAVEAPPAEASGGSVTETPDSTEGILALARQQGPFKG